jgi:hypothetical protein
MRTSSPYCRRGSGVRCVARYRVKNLPTTASAISRKIQRIIPHDSQVRFRWAVSAYPFCNGRISQDDAGIDSDAVKDSFLATLVTRHATPAMNEDGNPQHSIEIPSFLALIHSDDLRLTSCYFIREARKGPYVGIDDRCRRHNIRARGRAGGIIAGVTR